uniref:Envelopment polyprotein n=1 Tax=Triniti virus TaxID=2496585 RepID=A0A3S8XFR6_9VIRU|nr:polyprotein [Triniti virus]
MRSVLLIFFLIVIKWCTAVPNPDRCFTGGSIIKSTTGNEAFPNVCVKDDISYIKTIVTARQGEIGQKSTFTNEVWRKFTVENWKDCRPERTIGGPIMILSIDDYGHIESEDYVCKNDCEIKVNREDGIVTLETEKLNYYQITGTTISSGWFKSITSISLKHTCENIKLQCGEKALTLHACFKTHMECYQYLNRGIIPRYMAIAVCSNLEIIILITFSLLLFFIFTILAKTYICYLLLPIFMPVAYVYGKLYKKSCKVCNECGLMYHPFSECGLICVCGTTYSSTRKMKLHRSSGLCPGYKYMMSARYMCKSKGWGLMLSILLATMTLSFITPVGAMTVPTAYNPSCLNIDDIPEQYGNALINTQTLHDRSMIMLISSSVLGFAALIIMLIVFKCKHIFLNYYVIKCEDCKMFHPKPVFMMDEFGTNRCGSCTCGCTDEMPAANYHQLSSVCINKYTIKMLRTLYIVLIIIYFINVAGFGCLAEEASTCSQESNTTTCWGPMIESKLGLITGEKKTKIKTAFPDVTDAEFTELTKIPNNFEGMLLESHKYNTYRAKQLIEAYFYLDNSWKRIYSDSTPLYMKWKIQLKLSEPRTCTRRITNYPCKCIRSGRFCEEFQKRQFKAANLGQLVTDKDYILSDVLLFQNFAYAVMHPTFIYKYVEAVESKDLNKLTNLANQAYVYYKDNAYVLNFIFLLLNNTERLGAANFKVSPILKNQTVPLSLTRSAPTVVIKSYEIDPNRTSCIGPRFVTCLTPRVGLSIASGLMTCEPGQDDYHNPPRTVKRTLHRVGDDVIEKSSNLYCRRDISCSIPFDPASQLELDAIGTGQGKCYINNDRKVEGLYNDPISKCKVKEKGFCTLKGKKVQVVLCSDNTMVEQEATGTYDNDALTHGACFKLECQPTKRLHPDSLSECTVNVPRQYTNKLGFVDSENLEVYRKHLEEDFFSTLTHFRFKPTSGLPHIVPTFIPVYIQGVETTSGMESTYIEFEITALGGKSAGLKLYTKTGHYVFDIVVYIRSSNVSSIYTPIYRTGPTISYNSRHEELCTGRCPAEITKYDATWMTFSREDTSTWGCEEFGCLAIGEGCIYGQCKDVVKPDAEVWKKVTEESSTIELCVSSPHNSYCTILDAATTTIDNKLDAQFKTVEAFKLPELVLVRNHRLYKGQINNLLEYNSYCGNVQIINGTVHGSGKPSMDYHCHAASRKDVIIRKCYENHYHSCLSLSESKDLVIDHDSKGLMKLGYHEKIMGTVAVKLHLGDIQYKMFEEKPELDLKGNCAGCMKCIDGIACHLTIISSVQTTCTITSDCTPFMNRLMIKPDTRDYYLKMECASLENNIMSIKLCETAVTIPVKIISQKPILEIGTPGQTPYVKEHDERCGTWLCKVKEEGLSFIFSPIQGFFGQIWHGIVIIGGGLLLLFAVIYILIPCCAKIKDTLATQEIQYKNEYKVK